MPRYSPNIHAAKNRRRLFDDRLHAFHAAYVPPRYPGRAGWKILNLIAGDSNHPRPTESKRRTIGPPMPGDPPVTSACPPFSSFGSFMKEIIGNRHYLLAISRGDPMAQPLSH
jgi:hypothetical protein